MSARRTGAIALFALLVVPGCVVGGDARPDVGAPSVLGEFAALQVMIAPGGRGGEPMLGVAPDGALFSYSSPPGESFDAVYRSRDGGRTWERVGPAPLEGTSGDPDLSVDLDGTIWYDALVRGCAFVAVSRDGGASWTVHEKLCLGASYDRPRIVATSGGSAYLYHHNGHGSSSVLRTRDHGATWTPVASAALEALREPNVRPGWGGGGVWNPVTGTAFLTYTVNLGPPSPLLGALHDAPGFGALREDGATFEIGTIPGVRWPNGGPGKIGGGLVEGAVDRAGNLYLAWAEIVGDGSDVRVAVSTDDGRTWSAPFSVDPPGTTAIFPALAAGDAGELVVAYYSNPNDASPDGVPARSEWNVSLAWTAEALAPRPTFQHANLSATPIKRGPLCTGGLIACEGNGDGQGRGRALLEYFDVQPLADGRIAAVWTDAVRDPERAVNVFGVTRAPLVSPASP